jgi:hypothetical protein
VKIRLWFHPHYVVNRLREAYYEWRFPDLPWMTRQANDILCDWLKPTDVGFEWGSGRSTVWLGTRVRRLISIEHDKDWAQRIRGELQGRGIEHKVQYYLEPDVNIVSSPDSRYVARIHDVPDSSLDFCIVDGWSRADCALACLPKLKPGGLLVLDNAQLYIPRKHKTRAVRARGEADGFPEPARTWQEFDALVADWRRIWTSNGLSDTALFVKPASSHSLSNGSCSVQQPMSKSS